MTVAYIFSVVCSSSNPISKIIQNLIKPTERDSKEDQSYGMPFIQEVSKQCVCYKYVTAYEVYKIINCLENMYMQ